MHGGVQRALSQQGLGGGADVDLIYAKLRHPAPPASSKDEYLPEMVDMRFRLTGAWLLV